MKTTLHNLNAYNTVPFRIRDRWHQACFHAYRDAQIAFGILTCSSNVDECFIRDKDGNITRRWRRHVQPPSESRPSGTITAQDSHG